MASISIACPDCDKKMNAPSEVVGKKIRCKGCGHIFVAQAAGSITTGKSNVKSASARPAPTKAKSKPKEEKLVEEPIPFIEEEEDEDDDDGTPYGMTHTELGPRCPECANEMEDEKSHICLHCGYNTRTRVRKHTVKTYDKTGMDYFIWWLPAILCVLGIIFLLVFDIVYCIFAHRWFADAWYEFLGHFAIKLWLVIGSLFAMFAAGKYAFIRLVFNYEPPEVEKK